MPLDPTREKRRKALVAQVQALVPEILRRFPGIAKIWIVGSVAKPLFFDLRSDVDIVVDGLPKDRYFDLYRLIEANIESKVDLIELANVAAKDRALLEHKVVIYEKASV